ncbi:MAG: SLC13 family permease [Rhodospirillales bacterium]|jgi:di/tricarboxylate transporter|nr:SLC13 family permease [Rhodospirillales bacterium]
MHEATQLVAPNLSMWVTFALIIGALGLYAMERVPVEVTSVGVLGVFMVYFHFQPIAVAGGGNVLSAERLVAGFANPALVTVLALLVIGQGMVRAGVLDRGARIVMAIGGGSSVITIVVTLVVVLAVSGFLNNIPVVVIFIPIMEAVARRFDISSSKVMMPLSFAAVLGGMTTIIGSGTNLLVSGALEELGEAPFSFFQFTVPGLVLAGVGLVFILLFVPKLTPDRAAGAEIMLAGDGRHYLAQITVGAESQVIGLQSVAGIFGAYPDLILRVIEREEDAFLPPFEGVTIQENDVLVVAGTRAVLADAVAHDPGLLVPDLQDGRDEDARWQTGDRMLAEVMVAPASRMAGLNLRLIGFRHKFHCVVLAVQRRSRMMRTQITEIPLEEGDILLVQGRPEDIQGLRRNSDVVLLEWSAEELPALDHAKRAMAIFAAVILSAASGLVPVMIAALLGAVTMVAMGVLSIRMAARSLDTKIFTMIPAALAMGLAMQATGGAAWLARNMITALYGAEPTVILSAFFLLIAVLSNIISAKAAAVLFTPIAVGIAHELNMPVEAFAVAVVFAANCAVATPIGYQTSLLVMGPGHYTFTDFARGGIPLIIILWLTFTLFAPWYYGI